MWHGFGQQQRKLFGTQGRAPGILLAVTLGCFCVFTMGWGSIQPQNDSVHNVSLIYGWEFLPRKHLYLVFNSVNEGDGTVNSIFSKLEWGF